MVSACFGGLAGKRPLQAQKLAVEVIDRAPDIKAEIGGDLVVARTRRMKLPGDGANQLLQARFHRHVDVFVLSPELEAAKLDLLADGIEPHDDLFCFLSRR